MAPRAVSMILSPADSSSTLKTLPSIVREQEVGRKMHKSHSDMNIPRLSPRSRGYSDSRARDLIPSTSHPLSRLTPTASTQPETLAPAATVVPLPSFSARVGNAMRTVVRERSLSVPQVTELVRGVTLSGDVSVSASGGPSFWSFNRREVTARPWNNENDNNAIPEEQKVNWEQTRKTVSQAVGSILGSTAVLAHRTLLASVPLLELVPIPGLTMAAKLLLGIWDAVQEVDSNRLVFLRLTERCACIVITLNQELQDAGEAVIQELSGSLRRIEELFTSIQFLMKKEGNIPFLKRYLKREETLRQIESLNRQLDQELQILGPSFQIRTVKVIKEFAAGMDDRIETVIQRVLQGHCCSQVTMQNTGLTHSPKQPSLLRPVSRRFLQPLEEIASVQYDRDRQLDQNDLRQQIDNALQSGNDSTMLEFLQIPREDILEAIKSMQRYLERTRHGMKDNTEVDPHESRDTLEREFIETGIDSLRRMSKSSTSLPSWTITRFEVDCIRRIGVGFFSDVHEGTWRGQRVAIKVLRDFSSSRLFVREVEIWKNLSHPNIVELLGASSASGNPPWFFVSPFAEHGDLGNYLRRLGMVREQRGLGLTPSFSSSSTRTVETLPRDSFSRPSRESDLSRFMLEIAMGMDYLHEHGIFHGDLKCANVLVDETYSCLISDFGQSEIRAEAYRMSGIRGSRGTLRWQAPEVLQGLSELTPAVDIYAYAITCVEVLNFGQMPWSLVDDNAVQFLVLKEDERPAIPGQYHGTPVHELLKSCWRRDPELRPSFSDVVFTLRRNRHSIGSIPETPPSKSVSEIPTQPQEPTSPISLSPCLSTVGPADRRWPLTNRLSFQTTSSGVYPASEDARSQEGTIVESSAESELYSASPYNDSSTTFLSENSTASEEFVKVDMEMDPKIWEARNERRYRMSLNHRYHHSLSLALWEPVEVAVGAVGYVLKPSGKFVTLFNAINPSESPDPRVKGLPSIAGYGRVSIGHHRHATRNAALRGLDAVVGFLSSGKRDELQAKNISRRASFPLRAGHKVAYMYTELTEYRYMHELDAAKAWFQANAGHIIEAFGPSDNVHREDLVLVIGVLQAPNYALFVSHHHPDGNVHFHTFSPRQGKPWGTFTTDTNASKEHGGPSYHEPLLTPHHYAYKVSLNGDPAKAVLLARLRFPPDAVEPTSL